MSRHESGFATMERRSEEIIADNNAVAAIEARAISPEVAVLNDIAELDQVEAYKMVEVAR